MIAPVSPTSLEAELHRITARALSPAGRYGHVALLLAALLMGVVIVALLATEPALPRHTRTALTAMAVIEAAWIGYAGWVLRQRRPLMARHRVAAGTMAVAFTGLFFAGACAAVMVAGTTVAWTAAVVGAGLLVLAIAMLAQARRRVAELQHRRGELERLLGQSAARE
ncbi:MAG TPA: hypothetical protein VLF18_01320 [Tahibacter sp.]|uniref:hypothetical protein n=1 Tax=Tahibacter sp. TaxID=2056211 RepID=UPI002B894775|nr:hypothetical protein [Tahibacter sp.]HSX58814.1 hypothetical protein [Tahibacter sp.]